MRPRFLHGLTPITRRGAGFLTEPLAWRSIPSRGFRSSPVQRGDSGKWSTPLAKHINDLIATTGPVPLAGYMRLCLTADTGSYYNAAVSGTDHDPIGVDGDFITSPEISQIFGELVGLWFVAEWMSQGRPKTGVQLIEVGPGRGTLMGDMLRTIEHFPDMANSLDAVYLVESSPRLRERQKLKLCGPDARMNESSVGYHSVCTHLNLPVVWTETIKSIPIDSCKMPFIVAHEFFDALPIHAFQSVRVSAASPDNKAANSSASRPAVQPRSTQRWREMVVSPVPPGTPPPSTRQSSLDGDPPEFQLTLSASPTCHSQYLPELSARYRKLKSIPDAVIEISPDAALFAADFAARIGGSDKHPKAHPSGAALVIDYGPHDTVPVHSLRGIRRHRRVSPFATPGRVDLSADVDFAGLAEAATRASPAIEVHGPVPQADFLAQMGGRERADALCANILRASAPDSDAVAVADKVRRAWQRLVDRGPDGMGKVYKALAILPDNDGTRRPVGFGGDVV